MRTNIIKVGNSKGLILSKTILDKYQIGREVNIKLTDKYIIIEPVHNPRAGWDELFAERRSNNDDELLLPDVFEDEQDLEWN